MPTISPPPKIQFFATDGSPLANGKLYTYLAGTTTPKATYSDYAGISENTNPIILDVTGSASVWLGYGKYDYALYDEDDVLQYTQSGLGDPLPTEYVLSDVSGADTIVSNLTDPEVEQYVPFMTCRFIAAANNTGAVTININGLGAKTVAKNGATPLAAGDITGGALTTINYDGTRFQLISESQAIPAVSLSCSGNSATATQATNASNINSTAQGLGLSIISTISYQGRGGPEVTATGDGAAMMTFLRPGYVGCNFGVDTDNVLKFGGYSFANAYPVILSNNIGTYMPGQGAVGSYYTHPTSPSAIFGGAWVGISVISATSTLWQRIA